MHAEKPKSLDDEASGVGRQIAAMMRVSGAQRHRNPISDHQPPDSISRTSKLTAIVR
jgi:hypothetical protein